MSQVCQQTEHIIVHPNYKVPLNDLWPLWHTHVVVGMLVPKLWPLPSTPALKIKGTDNINPCFTSINAFEEYFYFDNHILSFIDALECVNNRTLQKFI